MWSRFELLASPNILLGKGKLTESAGPVLAPQPSVWEADACRTKLSPTPVGQVSTMEASDILPIIDNT